MSMTNYPTSLDNGTSLPQPGSGSATNSPSHAGLHDVEIQGLIAVQGKVGIGASTPVANTLLRGTGTGTSAYAQAVLTTDVIGTLPVANGGSGVTSKTGTGNLVLSNSPTLSAPAFTSISNTGTLTLPTSTDTLVGRATTDTLTNKTITDASNSVSSSILTNPSKFSVYRNAAANTGNNALALITFDTKVFDTGTNYSTSTGKFTAPIAGFYQFNFGSGFSATAGFCVLGLFKNGTEYHRGTEIVSAGSTDTQLVGSAFMQLASNDFVQVFIQSPAANALQVGSTVRNYFNGFLVSIT